MRLYEMQYLQLNWVHIQTSLRSNSGIINIHSNKRVGVEVPSFDIEQSLLRKISYAQGAQIGIRTRKLVGYIMQSISFKILKVRILKIQDKTVKLRHLNYIKN